MIKKLKENIDKELASLLCDINKNLKIKAISPILSANIKDFVLRPGKRIRPILFILSYLGYTKKNKVSHKNIIKCSLAFELLHDFLLIHDDIIDNSDIRRGKPTMHRLFNKKFKIPKNNKLGYDLSIITGDILFASSLDPLLSFDEKPFHKESALRIFIHAAACTGLGEYIDVVNDTKEINDIKEKDVSFTYHMKTSKYTFETPLLAGAALAGANIREKDLLSRLSYQLGEAFQIQDDLLDIFSSTEKTGKPVLSDLKESKKTLLAWKTYRNLCTNDRLIFKRIFNKPEKTSRDLSVLRTLIINSKAADYCLRRVHSLVREAGKNLDAIKLKPEYKKILIKLIKDSILKTDLVKI